MADSTGVRVTGAQRQILRPGEWQKKPRADTIVPALLLFFLRSYMLEGWLKP